ncbi:MAG: hypothetical protein ACI8WT_003551 [Clostridium sp.]|jgi:hypothetical protein
MNPITNILKDFPLIILDGALATELPPLKLGMVIPLAKFIVIVPKTGLIKVLS